MYEDAASRDQPTKKSWEAPFVGDTDRKLAKRILRMKAQSNGSPYKNILPIIQSSGTGKSRLAHELAKFFVTIPMNIRPSEDTTAFPVPDHVARDFVEFTQRASPGTDPLLLAFWVQVFRIAAEYIDDFENGTVFTDEQELAIAWRRYLDENKHAVRDQLYRRAVDTARSVVDSMTSEARQTNKTPGWAERNYAYVVHQKLKESAAEDGPRRLAAAIRSRLAEDFKHPEIVILVYIDEVYEVSTMELRERPGRTVYDSLLDAFTDLGPGEPTFLLTMATDPYVVRRTGAPIRHQPTYTDLPFDLPLNGPLFTPGAATLADAAEPMFMARFGRPLFSTRLQATHDFPQSYVRGLTAHFALVKLLCYGSVYQYLEEGPKTGYTSGMIWAPLSVRLLLEFDSARSNAREATEKMIGGHMRIAYDMPAHNEFVESGTPSEPLLAEAAAWAMNSHKQLNWLECLAYGVKEGMFKSGLRGDLAARTLLMSAFDRAGAPHGTRRDPRFSRAVPVPAFLRALFGSAWHDAVLRAAPPGAPPLQDAFAGAYVRFSHFAAHDGEDELDINDALAAAVRGCALVLTPPRGTAHIILPVVMRDAPLTPDIMSFVLIQLMAPGESPLPPDDDELAEMFCGGAAHPVIHLAMQLEPGDEPPALATPDEEDDAGVPEHPCYQLVTYGCSPAVYGVINAKNKAHYAAIRAPQNVFTEHGRQGADILACVRRMKPEWEHTPGSFHWAADAALLSDAAGQRSVEGVFAV
ncbi:hypothetical protein PsYK624_113950 [Phanerochaete sordida]|uniref:Uncharacterized protein n=1 Tax=Phanerochaete sordida TaxID=48140 RepID=A0A9P3LI20_9APHY|nr:hypothetical protein PsYK624_113950 [Phanerochaete sordida]